MPHEKSKTAAIILASFFVISSLALAQPSITAAAHVGEPTKTESEAAPIQDNSFLLEEAYNQEYGVVQHISSFTRYWSSKDWNYSFTQEWPGRKNWRNQYSYSVLAMSPGAYPGAGVGLGDTMLNYRYQVLGSGETRVAFAPRISLLLPTGQSQVGRGYGGWGTQLNLPLSYVVNRHIVTHWNAGATVVPRTKNSSGDTALTTAYTVGQSVVWLTTHRVNLLAETVWTGSQNVVAHDQTQCVRSLFVSPGIRWAYNLTHHLQIVPGAAIPIGIGPSSGERGLFLYLSFEHPFKNTEPEAK